MALSRPLGESQEEEWYDIFLIYEEDTDEDEAFALKDLIEKHVDLQTSTGGRRPRVCMVDNDGSFPLIQSKFDHLEKCIKCSTFIFLYVTPEFLKNQWAKMRKNAALAESLDNPDKRRSVRLVYAVSKKSLELPLYNKELKGLDLTEFLQGEKLQSIISSESMMESRKKCRFLKLLTNILDANEKSLMSMQSENVSSVNKICDSSSVNARWGESQADPEDLSLSLGELHLSDTSDNHPSETLSAATNIYLPIQHQSEEFEEPEVTPANEHFATSNLSVDNSKDTVDSKPAVPMSDDTAQQDSYRSSSDSGTETLPYTEDISNKYGPIQINTNNFAPIVTTANKQSQDLKSDEYPLDSSGNPDIK